MRVRVSFSLVLFLVVVSGATLSQCVFVPENTQALRRQIEREKAHWPKTYQLVYDVQDEQASPGKQRIDLLGPNLTFMTPACSRLKLAAERSGETYTGHMIRQRMRFGRCRSVALRQTNIWEWPWAHGYPRGDLPPEIRGTYGAWQVRCADRENRYRCALVQKSQPDNHQATEITTHFTMAKIGGKIAPVWRVWVPRLKKNWFRGPTPEGAAKWEHMLTRCVRNRTKFTNCLNRARARFTDRRTREVWFALNTELRNLNFTKCVAEGCMVETPIGMSARAYAGFMRGQTASIKLYPLGDMPVRFQIRPNGFHEALEALSMIDQTEKSVQAGDRRKAL